MTTKSSQRFSDYALSVRVEIDAALEACTQYDDGCPDQLRQAIRHSLLAPCKRLRPLLVLMAAEACGSTRERAMPAAVAVEMIHTYSLIHDDLPAMDDDDLRRGLPSCHARFGEGTAILAGDALLAQAFQVLSRLEVPPSILVQSVRELATAAGPCWLVGGQADDLSAEFDGGDLQQLEAIHRRKTGALFVVSLRLGGLVAEASVEQMQALTAYGEQLGLAFQIVDDLLDVTGSQQAVGKRINKDTGRGKLTFPSLMGVDASRQRADLLVEGACRALECLGAEAACLQGLAAYVLERNQ